VVTSGLVGILLVATLIFGTVLHVPMGLRFSEIYILGSTQKFSDYPYNVTAGQTYRIYVGVENHEGTSAYYTIEMKFRNQTEPLPNATAGKSSSMQPLFECQFLSQDKQTIQNPINFSFSEVSFSSNQSQIKKIIINNAAFEINESSISNSSMQTFHYEIFFELWIYKTQSDSFEFTKQYVTLKLNLLSTE
jgi:uncharacterized membrane protein